MGKIPNRDAPDEIQIETMLSRFKPQPTARFYRKMNNAPWSTTTFGERIRSAYPAKPIRRWIWGMAAILLILAVAGLSFIPSVRAIAHQIFYSFISAPSNQLEIQVTLSNPGELFHFSDPANFSSSIQQAREQAGFVVKEINKLPEGLTLVGSRFDSSYDAVIILYQAKDYKLLLTQRPISNGEDVFSIGSSAQVKLVKIGGHQGEFVAGGWKAISTQEPSETSTPGSQTNISAIWDSNLRQYTLRWQAEGYIYELRSIGEGSPSQSELIILANELK